MTTQTDYAAYVTSLRGLRGRARTRFLDEGDLVQVLDEARRNSWGGTAGTTVANCYGYPASRMRLAAVRLPDGDYAVLADWGTAKRGCSESPLGGRRDGPSGYIASYQAIADGTSPVPPRWQILPRRDVLAAIRRRSVVLRSPESATWYPPEIERRVRVTRADSLHSGNCVHETERVAAWWPDTDAVTIRALRREVQRREPLLVPFARRAAASAVARQA